MAANLEEVVVTAQTFPNILALPVTGKIDELEIETTIESVHTDTLQVTEHPVESGASISDHSYMRPAEVVLHCGWSNSSLAALQAIGQGILSDATMVQSAFVSGSNTRSDYIGGIYSKLLAIQQSREPIDITTGLRQYNNMLITSLQVTRDQKTSQALMVTATCRQLIIVSTSSATLPPKESQAEPASTAEVQDVGPKQATAGTPAPGGSVSPDDM